MKERFENSPLIEIIAELRWEIDSQTAQGFTGPMPIMPNILKQHESAFSKLADKFSSLGYSNTDRLVPAGFPCLSHEPIIRFRFGNTENRAQTATLYQVGPGIFTSNALPPSYTSWDDFSPIVRRGVESLLDAEIPYLVNSDVSVILRYVDAFTEEYTHGKNFVDFAKDILGLDIKFPDAFSDSTGNIETRIPAIHIVHPLPFGNLQMKFGEGQFKDEKAILLEMSVQHSNNVALDTDSIMQAFSEARDSIHSIFFKLTRPIHDVMKVVEA